jgi:SpoVK/Ycf46/Vps4 family AAA+-type ATPase
VGADIEALCRQAGMLAIRDFVERNPEVTDVEQFQITGKHFEAALCSFTIKVGGVREVETVTIR